MAYVGKFFARHFANPERLFAMAQGNMSVVSSVSETKHLGFALSPAQ
jgi:hypothetical protein